MSVRISGGRWRGQRLRTAPGSRPTQERVREALFSSWHPRLGGASVLELFAGSGCVGLEALSRGALRCRFVDRDERSLRAVAANAAAVGATDVRTARLDLPSGLARLPGDWPAAYDLVFADPPYDFDRHAALLELVAPLVTAAGEVAIEHSSRADLVAACEGGELAVDRTRRYGETVLTYLRPAAVPAAGARSPTGAGW